MMPSNLHSKHSEVGVQCLAPDATFKVLHVATDQQAWELSWL